MSHGREAAAEFPSVGCTINSRDSQVLNFQTGLLSEPAHVVGPRQLYALLVGVEGEEEESRIMLEKL